MPPTRGPGRAAPAHPLFGLVDDGKFFLRYSLDLVLASSSAVCLAASLATPRRGAPARPLFVPFNDGEFFLRYSLDLVLALSAALCLTASLATVLIGLIFRHNLLLVLLPSC